MVAHILRKQPVVPFRAVNRRGGAGYLEGFQRHHLIPKQVSRDNDLGPFVSVLREAGLAVEDFATNGIMLPAYESTARLVNLPVHPIGHDRYNLTVRNHLAAIRQAAETLTSKERRVQVALLATRTLQMRLRERIAKTGFAPIGCVELSGSTDADIDAILGVSPAA